MNLLTMIIPLAVLASVVIGALSGLKNGFKKQSIRLASIVLALLLGILITGLICNSLIASFENMSNENLAELFETMEINVNEETMAQISENAGAVSMLLAVPIAFIISPMIFFFVYGILYFLTLIPYKILVKSITLKKEKKSAGTRLIGAGVGALQGLLIAVVIASPFAGISGLLTDAADALANESADFEKLNDTINVIPEDPTLNFLGAIGGNAIYGSLCTVDVHGESYNMKDELAVPVIKLISNASDLENIQDFASLKEEDKATLNALVEIFDESPYISDLCSNVLLIASDELKDKVVVSENGEIVENEAKAVFTQFTDVFFDVIADIAVDSMNGETSLTTDLKTLLNVYYLLSDHEVLSTISDDPEYAVDKLMAVAEVNETTGKKVTVMTKVVNTLNSNAHTRPMVTVLSQISVTALAGQFDMGGDVDITKVYNDVKTSVNAIKDVDRDALGEEAYVAEVSTILNDALVGNDLDIEENVINDMAQYIYDNPETVAFGDNDGDGELTDEEMNNIILTYYDVYVEYENSGEIPDDITPDEFN